MSSKDTKKIYCFDLDGTLCDWKREHRLSTPYRERIAQVNKLYDQGHKIIIDTARGSVTGKDYFELTEGQLKKWGLKYHELRVGKKTFADIYVDDKGINDGDFFRTLCQKEC